ncbi:MAG: tail fiber domain-containing protein [Crocinitomicaceae bacterium]
MKKWIISIVAMMLFMCTNAQTFPEGIAYQAQVSSSTGAILSNVTVGVRFNIRSTTLNGPILWQEDHSILLSDLGHFAANIGEGLSTGAGSVPVFSNIEWANSIMFLEMLVDENNIGAFVSTMTQQLMAVPFAFHSKTTDQEFSLNGLSDVDTSGIQIGDILEWNGTNWIPGTDDVAISSDTVVYSINADSSSYADTALYAQNCIIISNADSAFFSYYSDTSNYAFMGLMAVYADSSYFADTAGYAIDSPGNWKIQGNDNTDGVNHFLGTIDSVDLIVKSYNTEKMRIKANGKIGVGTPNPAADFHVDNIDGVVYSGVYGLGSIPATGGGTRMMFYPKKAAFRVGTVTTNYWDDASIGDYSFATGYNTRATGDYSAAFGINSLAGGEGSFAVGNGALATGYYAFAAGHNPSVSGAHAIGLGRGAIATDTGAIAIGYHPFALGKFSMSLGNYCYAHEDHSVAMGYHAQSSHEGAFIYNDHSDNIGYVYTTAPNQFMVKAAGGSIFYTAGDLSTGVELAPGAGAWSTLSDRDSKEDIQEINPEEYLELLDRIEVYKWKYIAQDSSINHIGPMAQDFYSTFKLGTDSTTINSGDFDGINMLLLKALMDRTKELENQNARLGSLDGELELLREQRAKLLVLLDELEKKFATMQAAKKD